MPSAFRPPSFTLKTAATLRRKTCRLASLAIVVPSSSVLRSELAVAALSGSSSAPPPPPSSSASHPPKRRNGGDGSGVMYDFWRGHPNRNDLPVDDVRSALRTMIFGDDDDNDGGRRDEEEALRDCLNYGPSAGNEGLISSLSSFLDRRTSDDDLGVVDDDDDDGKTTNEVDAKNGLFVTNGVSHGLELLCATRTEPGDVVMVERPTYFLAAGIFRSRGLILKPLPMLPEEDDEDERDGGGGGGVDVDRLSELVETGRLDPPPKMIYVVPSHQNPTGRTMNVESRRKLARFALRHGTLVVADEVYHLLDWGFDDEDDDGDDGMRRRRRPARMASFDRSERRRRRSTAIDDSTTSDGAGRDANGVVGAKEDAHLRRIRRKEEGCCVSVSSFTKIFAPGVRCGWIEGPEFVVRDLIEYGYIQSQGGCAPFVGRMMQLSIDSGSLDVRLDRLRSSYKRRSRTLRDALAIEPRIRVDCAPKGGYFLWIEFPNDVNSEELLQFCAEEKYGVKFMPGVRCDPFHEDDGDCDEAAAGRERPFESCARLCFADMNEEDLEEGAKRLVSAFRDFSSRAHTSKAT